MKTILSALAFLFLSFAAASVHAQVAINTTGSDPDSSAMLDVMATDKGVLVPRLSESQRDAISNPAAGLLIYNLDQQAFEYFENTEWRTLSTTQSLANYTGESVTVGIPEIEVSNEWNGINFRNASSLTQTFTSVTGRDITAISFSIAPDSETLSGILEVRDDASGAEISTVSYTSDGSRLFKKVYTTPIPVQAGGVYRMNFYPSGTDRHNFRVSTGDAYEGGEIVGGTAGQDIEFEIHVDTAGQLFLEEGEIQFTDGTVLRSSDLTFDGALLGISGTGQTVDLSSLSDASQTLSLSGNTLSISEGNSVLLDLDFPSLLDADGDTGILPKENGGFSDSLEFTVDGTSRWEMEGPRLVPLNIDGSILIGSNTGGRRRSQF